MSIICPNSNGNQMRILYSLWNCTNCIEFGENQQGVVWEANLACLEFMVCHFCVNFVEIFEKLTKIIQKSCFWWSSDIVICPFC